MPPDSPVPAATPAAVPASPVTPTPAPAADTQATGRGTRLFSMLAAESEVPPGKQPDKKPDPTPAPAPDGKKPDATPAPATPAPDEKPIRVNKKTPISKRPELPTAQPAPEAPRAAAPATPKDDADWEAQLVDEEKQLLDDAKEAEKHLPGRKGLGEQAKKFVKEHQKYLKQHPELGKADPDPDETAAYQTWLTKNRPALSESEQRTVSEGRITARVSKPLEEKTAELEHTLFVRDQEPKFTEQRNRVASELNQSAMPKEILDFATEHGVEVAKKEFADDLRVHNAIVSTAASDYDELVRLGTTNPKNGRPLSMPETNPSGEKFAQHERLQRLVQYVNDEFKNNAKQAELMRDGKWFVTREEWNSLPPASRGQFWTFTNQEIATRSMAYVKPAVEISIKQARDELAARGYERRKFVPPAPAAAPAVPPQPTRTPAGPGASPVPSPTPGQPAGPTPGSRLLSALSNS